MDESSVSHPTYLIVILDLVAKSWNELDKKGLSLVSFCEYLFIFLNSYSLLHPENRFAIISHNHTSVDIVFNSFGRQALVDTSLTLSSHNSISRTIKSLQNTTLVESKGLATFSVALSKALSIIHKFSTPPPKNLKLGESAASLSASAKHGKPFLYPRILNISATHSLPRDQLLTLSSIFGAEKVSVPVDTLLLSPEFLFPIHTDTPLSTQYCNNLYQNEYGLTLLASKSTNGRISVPASLDTILPELLTNLLPCTLSRSFLIPTSTGFFNEETFKQPIIAKCFCHKRAMSQGGLCVTCLCLYCKEGLSDIRIKYQGYCPTCNAQLFLHDESDIHTKTKTQTQTKLVKSES